VKVQREYGSPITVYVIKYWETQGIFLLQAETTGTPGMIRYRRADGVGPASYLHKNDWRESLGDAQFEVENRLARRIKAVDAKAAALRQLEKIGVPVR